MKELASIEQSLNRIGGKQYSKTLVSDYMSFTFVYADYMNITNASLALFDAEPGEIWYIQLHVINTCTFTLSKMFLNAPYILSGLNKCLDLKDKDFTENLYCRKILDDTVVKLREAFRVTSENLKMSTFPIINFSKKNILVPLSVSE